MIVIGEDGMDPGFVERHWADLPNLAGLRDRGSFARLATTTPPQSPVAWSTFTTGLDPSGHGIFDFVARDPLTMQPFLSMAVTRPARFTLPLGPYELPLTRPKVVSLRKGTAFWQLLEDRGISATIVHMPVNYPPVEAGEALAGMGTPDLRGTEGTFAFYTDDPGIAPGPTPGGLIMRTQVVEGHAELRVEGPPNSLRRDHTYASVTLNVDIDPDQPFARLAVADQTKTALQSLGYLAGSSGQTPSDQGPDPRIAWRNTRCSMMLSTQCTPSGWTQPSAASAGPQAGSRESAGPRHPRRGISQGR